MIKERMAGFLVMTIVVPLAILGYLILLVVGITGPNARRRARAPSRSPSLGPSARRSRSRSAAGTTGS